MTTKVAATVAYLEAAKDAGVTWRELSQAETWGHSNCSRILSDLHLAGDAVRLRERRNGCSVYVLAGYQRDREIVPHRQHTGTLEEQALADCLTDAALLSDKVVGLVASYQLLESRFQPLRTLGADLLSAVGCNPADDLIPL